MGLPPFVPPQLVAWQYGAIARYFLQWGGGQGGNCKYLATLDWIKLWVLPSSISIVTRY